jgi:hypothetical protein
MYQQVLNFVGIGILAAVTAIATIIANAMRIDRDPAVDGPRALVAEFFGLWVAFTCLGWSFMIPGPATLLWILRGVSGTAAIIAFALAAYFAGTPEVRVNLDDEPTGFNNPITALKLDGPATSSPAPDPAAAQRRDQVWSELNTQN